MTQSQKFRGIHVHKDGGYTAAIGHKGKSIYLGWFRDFDSAKVARLDAEVELFGAIFDRREIVSHRDYAEIPLHSRSGAFYGYTKVDLRDVERVAGVAWTLDPREYVAGRPAGCVQSVTMHRWLLFGKAAGGTVDHRSGDKLDNRRSNLRECTQMENARNTRISKNNTSGFKGVSRTAEGRWRARITVDRKEVRLGVFDTPEAAATAYDAAAKRMHGEFASPNSYVLVGKRYGVQPGVIVNIAPVNVEGS